MIVAANLTTETGFDALQKIVADFGYLGSAEKGRPFELELRIPRS